MSYNNFQLMGQMFGKGGSESGNFRKPAIPIVKGPKMADIGAQKAGKMQTTSDISGELIYHEDDPSALKCLIAANMAGCLVGEQRYNKRNNSLAVTAKIAPKFKGNKANKMSLSLKLTMNSEEYRKANPQHEFQLSNPFSISWLIQRLSENEFEKQTEMLSTNFGQSRTRKISTSSDGQRRQRTYSTTSEYFPFSDIVQAQIMQWNDFSVSEIKPFLLGIMINKQLTPTRAKLPENLQDKKRLSAALNVLNQVLENKKYLLGSRCTLADIFVAVDLIPILDMKLSAKWPDLKTMQQGLLKEHHVYLRKWFVSVMQMPFVGLLKKKCSCYSAPFSQSQDEIGGKGDVNSKVNPNASKLATNQKGKKGENSKPKGDAGASIKIQQQQQERNDKREAAIANFRKTTQDLAAVDDLPPLKVLALHDYQQNQKSFKEMVESFKKEVGKHIEFTFIDAPNIALPYSAVDINEQNQRGWWFSRYNDYFRPDDVSDCNKGFESSIDELSDAVRSHGPFDGIMGFSQGASLAAMVCLDAATKRANSMFGGANNESVEYVSRFPSELSNFKFAILFSGFRSKSSQHSTIYSTMEKLQGLMKDEDIENAMIPTLHVIGKKGRLVTKAMSEELLPLFGKKNTEQLYYPGGYFVPRGGINQKSTYLNFVAKMKKMCFEGKNVEEVSGKLKGMVMESPTAAVETKSVDVPIQIGSPRQGLRRDSDDGEFASPPLSPIKEQADVANNIQRPGEGADHPVIRAIQELK